MWLLDWFRKNSDELRENVFLKGVEGLLKIFLGNAASEMWGVTRDSVIVAENEGGTGPDKFKKAYKTIEDKFKNSALPAIVNQFFEQFATAVIELAVIWLKAYVQRKIK